MPTTKSSWYDSSEDEFIPPTDHLAHDIISDMQDATGSDYNYFASYQTLTKKQIRALWITEGEKRGYELIDV